MDVLQRLEMIEKIYAIHQAFASDVDSACHKGCSACCTCNVTASTMEGLLIYNHLEGPEPSGRLKRIIAGPPENRFRPKVTINQMAAACLKGEDLPEETNDPTAGTCGFLDAGICTIYPVRPFGCRAMLSDTDCRMQGEAQMPPFMLTVNNIIMQYIEAIDQPGGTGNLIDVLGALSDDAFRAAYGQGDVSGSNQGVLLNRGFPVLMVPPEHRQAVQGLLSTLNAALKSL